MKCKFNSADCILLAGFALLSVGVAMLLNLGWCLVVTGIECITASIFVSIGGHS